MEENKEGARKEKQRRSNENKNNGGWGVLKVWWVETKIERTQTKGWVWGASMKCRSEKHPHHAEGGGAGPAALRRCLGGWRWDGGRWEGLKDSVSWSRAHPRLCWLQLSGFCRLSEWIYSHIAPFHCSSVLFCLFRWLWSKHQSYFIQKKSTWLCVTEWTRVEFAAKITQLCCTIRRHGAGKRRIKKKTERKLQNKNWYKDSQSADGTAAPPFI